MMATKMNGFRKAVVVGVIAANFGLPLVGRAQEKSSEFPAKQDTISVEHNISKEIEKIAKAQDSLQNRKESLVKLGEEAGYKKDEISVEKSEWKVDAWNYMALWVFSTLGWFLNLMHTLEKRRAQKK